MFYRKFISIEKNMKTLACCIYHFMSALNWPKRWHETIYTTGDCRHIFSIESCFKAGYKLGVSCCWFYWHRLYRATRTKSQTIITKWINNLPTFAFEPTTLYIENRLRFPFTTRSDLRPAKRLLIYTIYKYLYHVLFKAECFVVYYSNHLYLSKSWLVGWLIVV